MLVTDINNNSIKLDAIPVIEYEQLRGMLCSMMENQSVHIVNYFVFEQADGSLRAIIILADDQTAKLHIASYITQREECLSSLSADIGAAHAFEREISEIYGIKFIGHPFDKPLRFPFDRADQQSNINNYPFYSIDGESLHEVNVGPIHAGIIEPGAFRFICNGEKILNLEIVLGYQHRAVEQLLTNSAGSLRGALAAESIAGDSVASHASAYAALIESLYGCSTDSLYDLHCERAIALELERIALHLSDTAGLSTDIAYQLGQVACEALRTIIINTSQAWCGNRFTKGLIRPCGTHFPLNEEVKQNIIKNVTEVARRYREVADNLLSTPSVLSRFEDCGVVSTAQMIAIGGVGVAARASGLRRDIRSTHPYGPFVKHPYPMIVQQDGDVICRLKQRIKEIEASAAYILQLLEDPSFKPSQSSARFNEAMQPDTLAFSIIEGWRGEICHAAVTNGSGEIIKYKVKDPSLHNWYALGLACRNIGISDFPINNKSFNLSYCGHDL